MKATASGLMTFAEFEQLPDPPSGFRYELHHGELVEVPPAKFRHYRIQVRVRHHLTAAARGAGWVETEWGFRALPNGEYRVADVAFVSSERVERIPLDGYLEGAPDIVVEVLSASNTAAEMLDREQICLENGSREFWVIDPVKQLVRVSTSSGHAATYKSGRQIPVLFGGFIDVDAIFS